MSFENRIEFYEKSSIAKEQIARRYIQILKTYDLTSIKIIFNIKIFIKLVKTIESN
jgi:hypothetical protein